MSFRERQGLADTVAVEAACTICHKRDLIPTKEHAGRPGGEVLCKPCACESYTHLRCCLLRNDLGTACPVCEVNYYESPELDLNASHIPPNIHQGVQNLPNCNLCGKQLFLDGKAGTYDDYKFIHACKCDGESHHGCVLGIALRRPKCKACKYTYKYRMYGTFCDFLQRRICSFSCGLFIAFFVSCAALFLLSKAGNENSEWWVKGFAIFALGAWVVSFLYFCYIMITWCWYKWPSFKIKHTNYHMIPCRKGDAGPGIHETHGAPKIGPYQLGLAFRYRAPPSSSQEPTLEYEYNSAENAHNLSLLSVRRTMNPDPDVSSSSDTSQA